MTTDWRRVRQLVEGALERPAEERTAYVSAQCESDLALRERVLELLAQEGSDTAYSSPSGERVFVGARSAFERGLPSRLGPWELRRQIGSGGMGSVYLAVRADGQFQRQVAVKVIREGMDHREILARFQRERQVQANLDHPGIARMLDAGVAEGGLPYLVLEYVEGVPIDRHCDENRLSAEERIELFRKVCDAVHHAHQNLVVHRDLKPNNILVTPDGEPKLLDFGIAKLLDPEKAAGVDVTQVAMRFMTPTYASPEQIRNRPVTTASDVYSLGVILYQLLTGHPPLDLGTSTPAEIERVVCEVDPPRPSTIVTRTREVSAVNSDRTTGSVTPELVSSQRLTTPRGLARALSGDLDSVVLMAMRKEPLRRYGSAAELAEDLRRYLSGLPVTAQPDTAFYRTSKFVRRNALAVAASLVVLVSLVSGLILTRRAQYAESEQRVLAEAAARQLGVLATDLEQEKQVAEERAERMRVLAEELAQEKQVAEQGAERMRVLAQELEQEKAVAQQRLDDVRAFSTTLIFDIGQRIIPLDGAAPALRVLCETGVQFLDKLERDAGEDASFLRQLAISYARLGEVQALGEQGRPGAAGTSAALASVARGVQIATRAFGLEPSDPSNAYALATCLTYEGRMLESLWRPQEAERSLRQALDVCEEGIGPAQDPRVGHLYTWWLAIDQLANNLRIQLRQDEADELIDPATRVLERLQERWPDFPAVRSAEVRLASWSAQIALRRGEPELAIEQARHAVDLQQAVVAERPQFTARWDLWKRKLELVAMRAPRADPRELMETVEGALDFFEASCAADPSNIQARFDLIRALGRLSGLCSAADQPERAREAAVQAVGRARGLLETNPDDPTVRFLLVDALLAGSGAALRAGALSEALDLATEARVLVEDALLREDRRHTALQMTWQAYAALGRVSLAMARSEDAGKSSRRSSAARARDWLDKALTGLGQLEALAGASPGTRGQVDRIHGDLRELERVELALD